VPVWPFIYILEGGLRRRNAVRRSSSEKCDRVVRSPARAHRTAVPMKQSVHLGDFALTALAGDEGGASEAVLASWLVSAIRLYLSDKDSDRPEWAYPAFLPGRGRIGEKKLELDIDEGLWRAFVEEAGRQKVSVSQLASHAALYYAAELNAGRLTRRIAGNLEGEGP
jgi:hypothetical protein